MLLRPEGAFALFKNTWWQCRCSVSFTTTAPSSDPYARSAAVPQILVCDWQGEAMFSRLSSSPILTFLLLATVVCPATAQVAEAPANAPVQAGPLVLAPVVRLTNAGYDNNVFNRDEANKLGDVMATLSPSVDGWLRMAHGRASGRSQFDIYYFRTLTDLRSVDSEHSAQIEIPVNRVKPYFYATLLNTRHRQSLEIDALDRRRTVSLRGGFDVRLTAKTTASVFAIRDGLDYALNSLYRGTDLSRVLNHTSLGQGANISYALTPFTAVNVEAQRQHDDFTRAPERNSDNTRITTGVTFAPRALIHGTASIGVQNRKFLAGTKSAAATGTFVAVDLGYTLLGRTVFSVNGHRELEYSYLIAQPDYLSSGASVNVTQRMNQSWELSGSIGRHHLVYNPDPVTNASLYSAYAETVVTSSGDIAYILGHSRIGFRVEYSERLPSQRIFDRGYQRLRLGSTFTYAF